jgi:predicted ferric reductase
MRSSHTALSVSPDNQEWMTAASIPSPAPLAQRRRYRQATAAVVWLFLLGNLAGSIWLWIDADGLSATSSTGDTLTSIGRITGMVGAYLALVQVLLLARLPWLERLAGFDRLSVWHRLNGKLCLYLVLAHVVFTTVGYALLDEVGIWAEIVSLLTTTYPGMIVATIGTVLFVIVAASSYTIAKRRLRYEVWYAVHFTAYAAIALAWFHQVPTGTELSGLPVATAYWDSLYIATLALLVVFRVLVPAGRTLAHGFRVAAVEEEAPGVVTLTITGRRLDRLRAEAGQFFLWRFLTGRLWLEAHPYSLSAAPDGRSLRITVKDLGDHSRRVGTVAPGTRVVAEGPFGVFTQAVRRSDRVVLIAGGIGITPVRALLEEMQGDVVVVYRAVAESDLVLLDELERIAADRGARLVTVLGDHAAPGGERLLSTEHLRELVPDIGEREVYLCGPPAMTAVIERSVRAAGVPRRLLHVERFAL